MILVSPAHAYEIWAESYDSQVNPMLALETRALCGMLDGLSPTHVVDIGCGTGRWLSHLSGSATRMVGLDASPHMLARARRKPGLKDHLVVAEADHVPVVSRWADLVLCSLSLGYFADLTLVFKEFARITRPAARVVVTDLHPDAMAAGWTRSFRAGGMTYNIATHTHSFASIQGAANGAGFALERSLPIHFGDPEYPLFQQAGKSNLFEQAVARPALFIDVWRHPC
jgi:ubiquinone/menaquinone biosynthesis C-methylase UbiE